MEDNNGSMNDQLAALKYTIGGETYEGIKLIRNQAKVTIDNWNTTHFVVTGYRTVNIPAFGTVAPHHPEHHFHIVDKSTSGSSFHTCVKIELPEYFHHEGKTDTLNSRQRKALVDFLEKPFDEDTSNWEYLIMTWNINGSGKRLSKKMPIPDYTKLK
jgi:hypothetical protein